MDPQLVFDYFFMWIYHKTLLQNPYNHCLIERNLSFIIDLSKKYNVVTTQKVDGIKCTRDYNLTVKDIAAISLNIPKFIAIESGVITGLYNKFVVDNPQKVVFTLSNYAYHACSFNNFIWVSGINKLRFLLY